MTIITKKIKIEGMTCGSCEKVIGKQVIKLEGVQKIRVDYPTETVEVEFDEQKASLEKIKKAIVAEGYKVE